MREMVPGGEASIAAFETLFDQWKHHGFDRFHKELRAFVLAHDWQAVFPVSDKTLFFNRSLAYYKAASAIAYSRHRQEQLATAGYALLVYRCLDKDACMGCGELHGRFDGLVLPRDHAFWNLFMPPSLPGCDCHVSGAHSPKIAGILGGDLSKVLPEKWDVRDPATGLPLGVAPLFKGGPGPSRREILAWVAAGNADLG